MESILLKALPDIRSDAKPEASMKTGLPRSSATPAMCLTKKCKIFGRES